MKSILIFLFSFNFFLQAQSFFSIDLYKRLHEKYNSMESVYSVDVDISAIDLVTGESITDDNQFHFIKNEDAVYANNGSTINLINSNVLLFLDNINKIGILKKDNTIQLKYLKSFDLFADFKNGKILIKNFSKREDYDVIIFKIDQKGIEEIAVTFDSNNLLLISYEILTKQSPNANSLKVRYIFKNQNFSPTKDLLVLSDLKNYLIYKGNKFDKAKLNQKYASFTFLNQYNLKL